MELSGRAGWRNRLAGVPGELYFHRGLGPRVRPGGQGKGQRQQQGAPASRNFICVSSFPAPERRDRCSGLVSAYRVYPPPGGRSSKSFVQEWSAPSPRKKRRGRFRAPFACFFSRRKGKLPFNLGWPRLSVFPAKAQSPRPPAWAAPQRRSAPHTGAQSPRRPGRLCQGGTLYQRTGQNTGEHIAGAVELPGHPLGLHYLDRPVEAS